MQFPSGFFELKKVLFRPGGVNLQVCLCGVPMYASAQSLDFLARTKNATYPNRKLQVSQPVSFDVEKPGGH